MQIQKITCKVKTAGWPQKSPGMKIVLALCYWGRFSQHRRAKNNLLAAQFKYITTSCVACDKKCVLISMVKNKLDMIKKLFVESNQLGLNFCSNILCYLTPYKWAAVTKKASKQKARRQYTYPPVFCLTVTAGTAQKIASNAPLAETKAKTAQSDNDQTIQSYLRQLPTDILFLEPSCPATRRPCCSQQQQKERAPNTHKHACAQLYVLRRCK